MPSTPQHFLVAERRKWCDPTRNRTEVKRARISCTSLGTVEPRAFVPLGSVLLYLHVLVGFCFCIVRLHSVLPRHSDTQSQHLAKNNLDDVQTQNCPLVAASRDPRATQPERCNTRITPAQWIVSRCGKGRRGERPASPHVPCKCIHNSTGTRNRTQILHRVRGRTNDWGLVLGHHRGNVLSWTSSQIEEWTCQRKLARTLERTSKRKFWRTSKIVAVCPSRQWQGFSLCCADKMDDTERIAGSRESNTEKRTGTHQMMEDKMWWNAAAHLTAPMHITCVFFRKDTLGLNELRAASKFSSCFTGRPKGKDGVHTRERA